MSGFVVAKDKFYKSIVSGSWTASDGKKAGVLAKIEGSRTEFSAAESVIFQAPDSGELVFRMPDDRLDSPKRLGVLQINIAPLPEFKWPPSATVQLAVKALDRSCDFFFTKEGLYIERVEGQGQRRPGPPGGPGGPGRPRRPGGPGWDDANQKMPISINGVLVWLAWKDNRTETFPLDFLANLLKLNLRVKSARGGTAKLLYAVPNEKLVVRLSDPPPMTTTTTLEIGP